MIAEKDFYIGVDIGYEMATISYLEPHSNKTVIMDRSGGFGSRDTATKMLWLADEQLWLIGEDASYVNALEESVLIPSILEVVDEGNNILVIDREYDPLLLFGIFIVQALEYIYDMNPKAEVKKLTLTLTIALEEDSCERLITMIEQIKPELQSSTIAIIPAYEAVLRYLMYEQRLPKKPFYIMDFGAKAYRCYNIHIDEHCYVEETLFSQMLATRNIQQDFTKKLEQLYTQRMGVREITREEEEGIGRITQVYFPQVFPALREGKPLKITFDFAYPPFQEKMANEGLKQLIEPYEIKLKSVLELNEYGDAQCLFVTGNGIYMGWQQAILETLNEDVIIETDIICKGAALYPFAAKKQQVIKREKDLINHAYGVIDQRDTFIPIVKREDSYKGDFDECFLIMNKDDEDHIVLHREENDGKRTLICKRKIDVPESEDIYGIAVSVTFDESKQPILHIRYTAV